MFYTYIWFRERAGTFPKDTAYYVGKGKGERVRELHRRRSNHGLKPPSDSKYIIISYHLCEQAAFAEEKMLIRHYGRIDLGTGCLRNMTDGGEGITGLALSENTKAKISAAVSAANKARLHSEETRAKLCAAQKGRVFSEEHKARISAANKGHIHSPEARAKMSAAMKVSHALRAARGGLIPR